MSKPLDPQLTRRIAKLARLALTDSEVTQYTNDLDKILAYVAQLNSVNTDGVEPIIHGLPLDPHLREDEPIRPGETELKALLACSEQSLYEQFKVPQVIGGE